MENSGGAVSYYEKMDGLALWFGMSVTTVFFASLDRCACINVATYDDKDEEEAAPTPAFSDLGLIRLKFYVVGAEIFTGLTVALYPISVVKSRMQVASHDAIERDAFSVVKGLLKIDGIPGLYTGFCTVVTGAIPARIIFLTGSYSKWNGWDVRISLFTL